MTVENFPLAVPLGHVNKEPVKLESAEAWHLIPDIGHSAIFGAQLDGIDS